MSTPTTVLDRVAAAQAAATAAQAAAEQAIRDAVESGATIAAVAATLGVRNRQRIYAVLGRGQDGTEPTPPTLRPVIYLRGAGVRGDAWTRIEQAMWARGWATVRDRTTAWHLARGGCPVVLCDFSAADHGEPDPIRVGQVRARYRENTDWCAVSDLLTTADQARATRERWAWGDTRVARVDRDMDLPLVSGPGEIDRPYQDAPGGRRVLDEQAIARAVGAALGEVTR